MRANLPADFFNGIGHNQTSRRGPERAISVGWSQHIRLTNRVREAADERPLV